MAKSNVPVYVSFLLLVFLLQSCFDNGTGKLPDVNSLSEHDEIEILPTDTIGAVSLSAFHGTPYYVTGGASNAFYLFIEVRAKTLGTGNADENDPLAIVGRDIGLQVALPSGVELNNASGFAYEMKGQVAHIKLNDLSEGATYRILLNLTRDEQLLDDLTFSTQLWYTDVVSNYSNRHLLVNTVVQPTLDQSLLEEHRSGIVNHWIALFSANQQLEEALIAADNADFETAKALVKEAGAFMDAAVSKLGSEPDLVSQVALIHRYDTLLHTMKNMDRETLEHEKEAIRAENKGLRSIASQ